MISFLIRCLKDFSTIFQKKYKNDSNEIDENNYSKEFLNSFLKNLKEFSDLQK